MGQILLSLSEKGEKRLRYLAELDGKKKDAVSETVERALEALEKEMVREQAWKRASQLADADIDLGVGKFDRKEFYKGTRSGGEATKQRLISLHADKDRLLTRLAEESGGKKGSISSTVEESLVLLEREQQRKKAWKRLWELSDNAGKWGIGKVKRGMAYDDPRFG